MLKDKKVIMINGESSEWYEQAIFIVKNNGYTPAINFVSEAEKIINDYVNKNSVEKIIISHDKEEVLTDGLTVTEILPDDLTEISLDDLPDISMQRDPKSDFEATLNYIMLLCCIIFLFGIIVMIN